MAPIDVYTMTAISIAMINFMKTIPACISPGTGKNGSTVAVSSHLSCPPVQYQSFNIYFIFGPPQKFRQGFYLDEAQLVETFSEYI